ncbi:MAG: DMT family transporter [Archaeoglobaceae archaeon]
MSMSLELRSSDIGALSVITGSILMGFLVVFVRNIPLHPIQISFFRMFFGFLFLSVPIILSGKKPVINNPRIMAAIIVINTVVITSYITAVQMIEAATAALLLYMAPIYVLPAAYLRGARIDKGTWIALPIGLLGLYLMLTPYGELSVGLVAGMISGLCLAAIFFLMKTARRSMSSLHITFVYLGFASLLISPSLIVFPLHSVDILWLLGLGLIPTAIAFTLFYYGLKYCNVEQAPIFGLIEPLAAAIIGYMIFAELLEGEQIVGGVLILVSVSLAWKKVEKVKIKA